MVGQSPAEMDHYSSFVCAHLVKFGSFIQWEDQWIHAKCSVSPLIPSLLATIDNIGSWYYEVYYCYQSHGVCFVRRRGNTRLK